jgi:hypothetical protein
MVSSDDIGRVVEDRQGRVGVLRDVMKDWEDPAVLKENRAKRHVAFIGRKYGGGREWIVDIDQVTLTSETVRPSEAAPYISPFA